MSTDSDDIIDSPRKIDSDSIDKFGSQGTLLFLDLLVFALGGWIYWLAIVSKISPSEVGQVTAIYSLVALISILAQLGLEYPLLKRSFTQKRQILVTVLAIELVITFAVVPIVPVRYQQCVSKIITRIIQIHLDSSWISYRFIGWLCLAFCIIGNLRGKKCVNN